MSKPLMFRTTEFFYNLNKLIYYCSAINFWFEDLELPKTFAKIHKWLWNLLHYLIYVFILMEWAALFTQKHLTEKQASDRSLFCISHFFINLFAVNVASHSERIQKLLLNLTVDLKKVYNDIDVEQQMIRRAKVHYGLIVFIFCSVLVLYGIEGIIRTIKTDATFTTVITAWPDVNDASSLANLARAVSYVVWWVMVIRVCTVYSIIIAIVIALSYQFKTIQRYFCSLNGIFEMNLDQELKEKEYERALKVGIRMHSETLRCVHQTQYVSNVMFSGQIILNLTLLSLMLAQLAISERTLSRTLTILMAISSVIFSTGFIMCSAGDITIEASQLPNAVYSSGWQHCRGRPRRLLAIAMICGQRPWDSDVAWDAYTTPVQLQCVGILTLSYSSYVSIVKSSYSIFSVLF